MNNNKLFMVALTVSLYGCVAGAPNLTSAQESKVSALAVYKPKDTEAPGHYQSLGTISGADCSGAPTGGRVWGNAEKAIDTLKRKAVEIGADAVINVSCSAVPLLNNCWAAEKCTGEAIKIESKGT